MPPKGSKVGPPVVDAAAAGSSAAAQQQRAHSAGIAEFELPKTTLTKLAKGSIPDNVKMQQDVVLALHRSSTLFINYLTAASHDQAVARSGKQITASDVIKAITELDFGPADNLVPLLEVELAAYRRNNQASKAQKQAAKAPGPAKGSRRKSQGGTDVEMLDGDDGDALAGGYDERDDVGTASERQEMDVPSGGLGSDPPLDT